MREIKTWVIGFFLLVCLSSLFRGEEKVQYDPRSLSARGESPSMQLDNHRIYMDASERTERRTGRSALSVAISGPDQSDLNKAAAKEYWRPPIAAGPH